MIDDKKIEEAQEEIFEDKFLGNGEDVQFDNDDMEEHLLFGLGLNSEMEVQDGAKNKKI